MDKTLYNKSKMRGNICPKCGGLIQVFKNNNADIILCSNCSKWFSTFLRPIGMKL